MEGTIEGRLKVKASFENRSFGWVVSAGYTKKTPVIEWKSKLFPRCRGLFLSAITRSVTGKETRSAGGVIFVCLQAREMGTAR